MFIVKIFFALALLQCTPLLACGEIHEIDLASDFGDEKYTEISRTPYVPKDANAFYRIPQFSPKDWSFNDCKDALAIVEIETTTSLVRYQAFITTADECDGGNSYGSLYDPQKQRWVGAVADSFVTCWDANDAMNIGDDANTNVDDDGNDTL